MVSNLTWTPAAGGGTQTIQYKVNTTSTWTTYTVLAPGVNSIGVTGLNYNTLYDFQIINNCPTGGTTILSGQDIIIQCPNLLISPTSGSVTVQFTGLGGTIDTYVVQLLNATSSAIISTNTLTAPFPAMISTTFTGLTSLTTYNIKTIPSSGSYSNSNCATVPFTTSNTPVCAAPTGLMVTFS